MFEWALHLKETSAAARIDNSVRRSSKIGKFLVNKKPQVVTSNEPVNCLYASTARDSIARPYFMGAKYERSSSHTSLLTEDGGSLTWFTVLANQAKVRRGDSHRMRLMPESGTPLSSCELLYY